MSKDPSLRKQNDLARDVDRLLRQLPFGDPMLRGDGVVAPRAARQPGAGASAGLGAGASARAGLGGSISAGASAGSMSAAVSAPAIVRRATPAEPSALAQRISGWLRALLAVALAAAVTVWPYASTCGWMLYVALFVVATVVVAGVWAGIWTWRLRLPAAHVLSVGVLVWGLILTAELVLPRVGYAATTAVWSCAVR